VNLFSSLSILPHLVPTYEETIRCLNSSCLLNKTQIHEEKKWPLPLPLTSGDLDVESSYNNKFKLDHLKCSSCNRKTKEVIIPGKAEPEFLILMLDFVQNLLDEGKTLDYLEINQEINSRLTGKKYSLLGTINVPYRGHFNCIVMNPTISKENSLNGAWLHDGLKNNGYLAKFSNFDKITEYYPYILVYKRVIL